MEKAYRQNGYIALMATIIISIILLVMTVEQGTSGWYARFNILGTEAKEQAMGLAEGCVEQAIAKLLTDPTYTGNSTTTTSIGTCHIFPIQLNHPTLGLVTIKSQGVVRESYTILNVVVNFNDINTGPILNTQPTLPNLNIEIVSVNEVPNSY